jgi:hypothetical protein
VGEGKACLNSLGFTKWNISRKSTANAASNVPKAAKRVHEIFDDPTFLKNPAVTPSSRLLSMME